MVRSSNFDVNRVLLFAFFFLAVIVVSQVSIVILRSQSLRSKGNLSSSESLEISSSRPRPTSTPASTPTPTPTPRPIAQGKQIYNIISGNKTGPMLTELTVDPFDPKIGKKQMMSLKIKKDIPTQSVAVILTTDKKTKNYPLTLVETTEKETRWEASWTIEDTHLYIYTAKVVAKAANNETSEVELSFR